LWGQRYTENAEKYDPGLAFAGQYRDDESGLCYNRFRYYDPSGGCYISPDPISVLGGDNNYGYVHNPVGWVDPFGLASCRMQYVGRTPGKSSRTGREVIERMRGEGKVRGVGEDTIFQASDGRWHPLADADMSHKMDAVAWWNTTGRDFGPKSQRVREWMLDSNNYYLDHYSINRSQGASLGQVYLPPIIQ
ncbi:RHS repeat-associated core domain-containing protein, partial [Pectobacterium parmentieri]